MTHQSYFMSAPDKSPIVDDVLIHLGRGRQEEKGIPCYGPEHVKGLANYDAVGKGGYFTQRNVDSFAWFAMAKYAESQTGR